ncbi:MAG: hypothetical protein SPG64_00420 [Candidatus Enteromonas sp.]|nr:hypothetical protein [Candidatus Enteromonas sp.]
MVDLSLLSEFDPYLTDYVYGKLYSELSNHEQTILRSFQTSGPVKISDSVHRCGLNNKSIGVYRDRLIKKRVVFASFDFRV